MATEPKQEVPTGPHDVDVGPGPVDDDEPASSGGIIVELSQPVPTEASETALSPQPSINDETQTSSVLEGRSTTPRPPRAPDEPRLEYQHFIPRFVLREFAPAESRQQSRRNPIINFYSLSQGSIIPNTPVARCYGQTNMYQDAGASESDEMHIEKALSLLESQSAQIITTIKKAQAEGQTSVTLTRGQRNTIRKFLFVMKYRSQLFWAKYNCTLDDYHHLDRDKVVKFMQEKGFNRPIDVWLHTIKTILGTYIDAEDWQRTIMNTCFIHDAVWFIFNMEESFMAFCQPADSEDEFILSESCFGIHEGPTDGGIDLGLNPSAPLPASTENPELAGVMREKSSQMGWYTEYHKMAPFSSKLLLVLRSNHLRTEETKERLREMAKSGEPGSHQWKVPSVFDHLQLDPPTPSYEITTSLNRQDEDTFTFPLHNLCREDVMLFNSIILNEVRLSITWHSDAAMARTLKTYLEDHRFRLPLSITVHLREEGLIRGVPEVKRREQLGKLLVLLTSDSVPVDVPPAPVGSHIRGLQDLEKLLEDEIMAGYRKIGGTATNFMHDQLQGSLVSKMRGLIAEVLPKGPCFGRYRKAVIRTQMSFYSTLPPAVIYNHIQGWIVEEKKRQAGPAASLEEILKESVEKREDAHDVVANLVGKVPRQHLSRWMLQASFRQVAKGENPSEADGVSFVRVEKTCYGLWGGLISSFLIEETSWYDPSVGKAILDPYRDDRVVQQTAERELEVRLQVKKSGYIRARWGVEVDKFVWEWLYMGPSD